MNYKINEDLVYTTLGVPPGAMNIHGWDELDIKDLKGKHGIILTNSARVIDVSDKEIAKWTTLHKRNQYNDTIHCPPTYKECPVEGRQLVTGHCKTKGADGAGKETIRAIEVSFNNYDETSAADWERIASSNENRPLKDRVDYVKNDRDDVSVVNTLIQMKDSISLSIMNDDGTKEPTDKFINKKLKQLLIPENQWPKLKIQYRDKLGINQDQNVRTVTPDANTKKFFQEEVRKLWPNENILFVTMTQSNNPKMPTDLIRKVLDAKLQNEPYDKIIMDHYNCTNLDGLKRARKRDRNFFTDKDSWFCEDLKRFKSPLKGDWPEVVFQPQTDKEIIEWSNKKILI